LPLFRTKKEAFEWLMSGKKTIDVRKGDPRNGRIAVYLSGQKVLRMKILKSVSGKLGEIVREDNYVLVIPSATNLDCAIAYLRQLYNSDDGVFTAYYVALPDK
jgi:ASC-1-like (ASCH) protein